jgi:diguanylate cyclase (GGDEF)-like protein/PAS domain S-box-containing protein/putative nucleotidyltransferase with HDIG domain
LLLSALFSAKLLGLFPDPEAAKRDGRRALCESVAISASLFANDDGTRQIESFLQAIVERNADVLSAAVRRSSGRIIVQFGDHEAHWTLSPGIHSNATNIIVPISARNKPWGTVEVSFAPAETAGPYGMLNIPLLRLFVFVGALCALLFFLFLRKTMEQLDPSRVVPQRVRAALDTLAEGLLVLDNKDRIVLANRAFANTVGRPADELQGNRASSLQWLQDKAETEFYPWEQASRDKAQLMGAQLKLQLDEADERTFLVNSSPILSDKGENRGVLATFEDVTVMEANRVALVEMLEKLEDSRSEIQRQNKELQILATRDPLTSCLNRRAFFEEFEKHWSGAKRYGQPLSCVMLDIDYFKSVNDKHGHVMGDLVLKKVAASLKKTARRPDVVSRYGGEEFCVLLPHVDLQDAAIAAERFRKAIEDLEFPDLSITASFGVSAISTGASTQQEMLNQADTCLYRAKNNGRNRVVCWDGAQAETHMDKSREQRAVPDDMGDDDHEIPFNAVTALVSALAYRDASTAAHSTRVADLCVIVARGVMSVSDTYVLEMAALLHDIGKIGVPDSILLKPGPLTDDEWKIMGIHDQIGVEILRSSFTSPKLAEIVETHHAFFGGKSRNQHLPTGEDIPLGARILTIADAYDAMTSDRVYRKGRAPEEAFAELRRCAGTQFDPNLVEKFISAVQDQRCRERTDVAMPSKEVALQIGNQIEQIARALDSQDLPRLVSLAARLQATATDAGISQIEEVAAELKKAAAEDPELSTLVDLTHELLDLCRSTQKAYIDVCMVSEQSDAEAAAIDKTSAAAGARSNSA